MISGNLEDMFDNFKDLESKSEFEDYVAEKTKMRRKKYDEENQEGKGLKTLTPDQILSILPISLAQLKAGNNT